MKRDKLMKNNKVKFISAEFSVCLLGSPFEYHSDVVWSWCRPISDAILFWPSAVFLKVQRVRSLWLSLLGVSAHRSSQAALPIWLFPVHDPGVGQQNFWGNCPSLPLPVDLLSVSVDELTVSERTSGWIRRMGLLDLLWWWWGGGLSFRIQGKWWVWFPTHEPHIGIYQGLFPWSRP